MKSHLLKEFTVDEVSAALSQMALLKALGPDGFTSCFYLKNWATVGEEVCKVVIFSLNSGVLLT